MNDLEIIFRAISTSKINTIKNRPLIQTAEFYLKKARRINISIDMFRNGYIFYFSKFKDIKNLLDIVKIYLSFIEKQDFMKISDIKEKDYNNWVIFIEVNKSSIEINEILNTIENTIKMSSYVLIKTRKLKKPLQNYPNVTDIMEFRTLKSEYLLKLTKQFFIANKNSLFKINI
jgi:hypothetical protein